MIAISMLLRWRIEHVCLIITALYGLSPISLFAQCPTGYPEITVYFVNGVLTDRPTAERTTEDRLEPAIRARLSATPFPAECLEVKLAYNYNEPLGLSLFEAGTQAAEHNTSLFWSVVKGVHTVATGPRYFIGNLIAPRIREFDGSSYVKTGDPNLEEHISSYLRDLDNQRSVILVAHSQGNYYANLAYQELTSRHPATRSNVRIIAVATPASDVAGSDKPYFTLEQDFIHHVPGALDANRKAALCMDPSGVECHSFENWYLGWVPLASDIIDEIIGAIPPIARLTVSAGSATAHEGSRLSVTLPFGQTHARVLVSCERSFDPAGSIVGGELFVNAAPWRSFIAGQVVTVDLLPGLYVIGAKVEDKNGNISRLVESSIEIISNQPPTAGFSMSAPGQASVNEGGSLNVGVPPGQQTIVSFSADRSSDPDLGDSITFWEWRIDGSLVELIRGSQPSFSRSLPPGTYTISLSVTDSRGAQSQPVTGRVVVTESGSSTAGVTSARYTSHTATTLSNGFVLVTGGITEGITRNLAELYNPQTRTWRYTRALNGQQTVMNSSRWQHTASRLPDGRILIVGGLDFSNLRLLATAEVFDPATETFTPVDPLREARASHRAVELSDGRVMILGGYGATSSNATNSVEIFDSTQMRWLPLAETPAMPSARAEFAATRLPDGRVFVCGGQWGDGNTASAWLFNPSNNSWQVLTNLRRERFGHTASGLPDGRVLIAGGIGGLVPQPFEIYNPAGSGISTVLSANPTIGVTGYTATALPNGDVLLAGGNVGCAVRRNMQLFQFSSSAVVDAGLMRVPRTDHRAVLLNTGSVMQTGGHDADCPATITTESELWAP